MILSRNQIKQRWKNNEIKFEPEIDERQIQICSINLRVGYSFSKIKPKQGHIIDPSLASSEGLFEPVTFSQDRIMIKKNQLLLATTFEYITMPNNLAALVEGRSTFARYGLSAHITAPLINPGFVGNITLEVYNHGDNEIFLTPGITEICQLIFFTLTEPIDEKIVQSFSKYLGQTGTIPKPDKK